VLRVGMSLSESALPLFLIAMAVGACGVAGARHLGRSHGFWPGSWGCLLLAASFELLGREIPALARLAPIPAGLFPLWMYAGALAFAGRARPRWLALLTVVHPLARGALANFAPPGSTSALALAVEPGITLAASVVLYRALPAGAPPLDRALPFATFVFACFLGWDAADGIRQPRVGVHWAPWLIFGGSNAALQILATFADARSRQLLTQRALGDERERLRTILASLGTANVVWIDAEGRVRPLLAEIPSRDARYGVGYRRVMGRPFRDFVPGEAGERIWRLVSEVLATGEVRDGEAAVSLPNGTFQFEFALRPLAASADEPGVLAVARDVTERHRAEAESRRLADELQLAKRAESLDLLAGGVVHDFNNLLHTILGSAELAEAELRDGGNARAYLADIRSAGERAAKLTEQLLAYTGRAHRRLEDVDLVALVRDLWRVLQAAVARQTELTRIEKALPPRLRADAMQLQQVLMNLVRNAAEALPGGVGHVTVEVGGSLAPRNAHGASPAREIAYLEVRDDGCGMDAATRERIFDPFFTTKLRGRGLGLATVQGIVNAHGGRIQVESAPGSGTRIRIELPAPTESEPAAT
jgi:PAS domain S-box-containing protein